MVDWYLHRQEMEEFYCRGKSHHFDRSCRKHWTSQTTIPSNVQRAAYFWTSVWTLYLKETIGWWSSGPRRSWCASSRMVVFASIDRIIKTVFVDGGVGVGALPVGYLELWWLTNIFVKRVMLLKMRGVEGSWFLRSQGPFLFFFFWWLRITVLMCLLKHSSLFAEQGKNETDVAPKLPIFLQMWYALLHDCCRQRLWFKRILSDQGSYNSRCNLNASKYQD